MTERSIPLYQLAHARTGDKGNCSNISVIAFRAEDFPLLVRELTVARVSEHFSFRRPSLIQRFVLPQIFAMNFVIEGILDGGVNISLNLDAHGKSLSYYLLDIKISVSDK